jgi:hypothetical protein
MNRTQSARWILAILLAVLAPAAGAPGGGGGGGGGETVDINVPAGVSFLVTDLSLATPSTPLVTTLSFSNATLSGNHRLVISVKADATTFSLPAGGGTAIPVSAVSWTTSGATGGVGSAGTLNAATYTRVFLSDQAAVNGSVDIAWNLAVLPAGVRPGVHGLTLRWFIDSVNK